MPFRRNRLVMLAAGAAALSSASPAFAHPGPAGHDFLHGVAHPISGLDHLLAMVAVGLLGARLGGRAMWALPVVFLVAMCGGGLASTAGQSVPGVEAGILTSVLVLGGLVAASALIPVRWAAMIVAMFACLHGSAHTSEMIVGGSFTTYALGFLLATAGLHLAGIGVATAASRVTNVQAVRWMGGAVSAAGAMLMLGWL